MSGFNYVPNPRAHLDLKSWSIWDPALYIARVTSVPWGPLPAGADAAFRQHSGISTNDYFPPSELQETGVDLPWCFTWGVPAYPGATSATLYATATFWDSEGAAIGGDIMRPWVEGYALDTWHHESGVILASQIPEGAATISFSPQIFIPGMFNYTYFTLCCIGHETYADGDMPGWAWMGEPHNSISRTAFDWDARYPRQVIGGNGVDTLDAVWEIDRHGGYGGASLEVIPPIGIARHDVSMLAPAEIRDPLAGDHLLWAGRVEEPGLAHREARTQSIECTGHIAALEDSDCFLCNYVDTEIGNWDTTQCTRFADRFEVGTIDDDDVPKLVLRARTGILVPKDANARAYWYPTNARVGAMARRVKFTVTAIGLVGDLRLRLYASRYPGAAKTQIWSRTTDCEDLAVDITSASIPSDTACLTFRIENLESVTYMVYGDGDPETWGLVLGAEISNIRVYGSSLDHTVTPERVAGHVFDLIADDEHRDLPDASGLTVGQLAYFEPGTTARRVLDDVNALVDWDYGMGAGEVVYFRKPLTAATAPPDQIVVVSRADPRLVGWDVRLDWADVANHITAYYTKPNGRYGVVNVSDYESGPLTTEKQRFLDLRGICDSADEATAIAQRALADALWPRATGTVTLRDTCTLANGFNEMPAIHITPGMLLLCPDLRPEDTGDPAERGHMLITHVRGSLAKREIVLTVGRRARTLDMLLARRELVSREAQQAKKKR